MGRPTAHSPHPCGGVSFSQQPWRAEAGCKDMQHEEFCCPTVTERAQKACTGCRVEVSCLEDALRTNTMVDMRSGMKPIELNAYRRARDERYKLIDLEQSAIAASSQAHIDAARHRFGGRVA